MYLFESTQNLPKKERAGNSTSPFSVEKKWDRMWKEGLKRTEIQVSILHATLIPQESNIDGRNHMKKRKEKSGRDRKISYPRI